MIHVESSWQAVARLLRELGYSAGAIGSAIQALEDGASAHEARRILEQTEKRVRAA